jgi:hypothetical protein
MAGEIPDNEWRYLPGYRTRNLSDKIAGQNENKSADEI